MYCTTCGKSVEEKAAVCLGCGCPPLAGRKFCWNCGQETDPQAVVCTGCGAALTAPPPPANVTLPRGKPGKLTAVAAVTLGAGVLNCLYGLVWIFGCWTIVCTPFCITLGIFEILYAVKLLAEPVKVRELSRTMAVLEIVAIILLNPVSLTAGILSLVFANDPEVKAYLAAQGEVPGIPAASR
jgi:hypothetical protein